MRVRPTLIHLETRTLAQKCWPWIIAHTLARGKLTQDDCFPVKGFVEIEQEQIISHLGVDWAPLNMNSVELVEHDPVSDVKLALNTRAGLNTGILHLYSSTMADIAWRL